MSRLAAALICLFTLAACDSGEPGGWPLDQLEGDVGEAAIRHVIANLPDPAPGVPKIYCIIIGQLTTIGTVTPARASFVKRFDDLKLNFVGAGSLKESEPDHAVVDTQSGLAPYLLQIRRIKTLDGSRFEVEAAWSYKKQFERRRLEVEQKDGRCSVIKSERTAGGPAVGENKTEPPR